MDNSASDEPAAEWRETAVGHVTFRYLTAGNGPPLVLLHGLSGSPRWWRHNLGPLSRQFRVYAIDLVHFRGGEPRPRFVLAHAAERLGRWLAALGIEKAALAGHSMGGHIAARLAADFPEKVERLVLVDPALFFPPESLPATGARLLHRFPHAPMSLLPVLVQDALRAGPLSLWSAARDLRRSDLREKLRRIQAPTLLVWGARDGLVPVAWADEVAALIPNCKLRILPHAGHNPMWEEPAIFNELLREFLSR
jgi:pimeloyl-ACP methyl ester carboxylesterase